MVDFKNEVERAKKLELVKTEGNVKVKVKGLRRFHEWPCCFLNQ